jgi:hypothetical protein
MKKDTLPPVWVLGVGLASLPRKTQLSGNSSNGEGITRKWAEATHKITIR